MPKYMAAGRNGGYRDNEVRDRESDVDVSRREIGYSKGENGNRDYERSRGRGSGGGGRDRGRVRQKDIRERELSNGGSYRSVSGLGSSGSSGGGGRLRGLSVGSVDREPGELSSESGSEEAADSSRGLGNKNNSLKGENGNKLHLENKKRKFSPIVWDRDEVSNVSKQSVALSPSVLPPPPPLPKSYRESPNPIVSGAVQISPIEEDTKLQPSELPVEPVVDIVSQVSDVAEFPAGLPSPLQEQHAEYNEDYAPTLNIRSSRWANDANSSADEGEISDSPDVRIQKKRRKMPLAAQHEAKVRNKLISPELMELKREGSEGARARSSESDEGARGRSSSRDNYADKDLDNTDYMEIDIEQNNGGNSGHTDTDSEEERHSRGTPEPAAPPRGV